MILPAYHPIDPAPLAVAVLARVPGRELRAAELAVAACAVGRRVNVDAAWLCAVALGETPSLRPDVPDGVCQVVGGGGTIGESVEQAGVLYARIVRKHGRRDAHLVYGCGMDRCGGQWTRQAEHKVWLWRRLRAAVRRIVVANPA